MKELREPFVKGFHAEVSIPLPGFIVMKDSKVWRSGL